MNGLRLVIFLLCLTATTSAIPSSAATLEKDHYYTTNVNGNIDWSTGKITVWGMAEIPPVLKDPDSFHYQNGDYGQPRNLPQARLLAKNRAREKAFQNAYALFMKINVQNGKKLATYMSHPAINEKVNNYINSPYRLKNIETASNRYRITLEYNLYGEKGLLLLNDGQEIEDNFINFYYEKYPEVKRVSTQNWQDNAKVRVWDGLVISMSAYPMSPALNPRILDENGRVVYDSSLVYADEASKTGLVLYTRKPFNLPKSVNVRFFHCTALGTRPLGGSDIVISNEDAETILSSPGTLENLRRCRVVILGTDSRR